jgi:hypothetical protein
MHGVTVTARSTTQRRPTPRTTSALGVVVLLTLAACGTGTEPTTPRAERNAGQVIALIEATRTIRLPSVVEPGPEGEREATDEAKVLRELKEVLPKVEAEREALIEELLALGDAAARRVVERIDARPTDAYSRMFWMGVLLRFDGPVVNTAMPRLLELPLTDSEMNNVASALPRHRAPWSLAWAIKLTRARPAVPDADPFWGDDLTRSSIQRNALTALGTWDHPDARATLVEMGGHPSPSLRSAAVCALVGPGYAGDLDVLGLVVGATRDAEETVAETADICLRSIVEDAAAPPRTRLRLPVDADDVDRALAADRAKWAGWFLGARKTVQWDPVARRFFDPRFRAPMRLPRTR